MAIRRRNLLIGTALAATATLSKPSWAPPPPPAKKGVWAVQFDGNTLLQANQVANTPISSTIGCFAYTFAMAPADMTAGRTILYYNNSYTANPNNIDHIVQVQHLIGSGYVIQVQLGTAAGGFYRFWSTSGIPTDGLSHTAIVSWDSAANFARIVLDGQAMGVQLQLGSTAVSVNYATKPVLIGGDRVVKGRVISPYKGMLSEVFFYPGGTVIDPTNPSILAGFYDVVTGLPIRNDGTGASALPGTDPAFYLSGPTSIFGQNLAQQTPTVETSIWADSSPSSKFLTVAGALKVPTSDPWGLTGV